MRPIDLEKFRIPSDPRYHPDGRRIIFASNHPDPRNRNFDLYLIGLDGTGLELGYSVDHDAGAFALAAECRRAARIAHRLRFHLDDRERIDGELGLRGKGRRAEEQRQPKQRRRHGTAQRPDIPEGGSHDRMLRLIASGA